MKDSNLQPSRSERDASTSWANTASKRETGNATREINGREPVFIPRSAIRAPRLKWCSRQESHLQPPRSKRGALIIAPRERNGQRENAEGRGSSRIKRGLSFSTIFQSAIPPFEIGTDEKCFFPAKHTTHPVISRSAFRAPRPKLACHPEL